MTYNILFIDEEKSNHRIFKVNFIEKNKEVFTGIAVFPNASIEEMMDKIQEINPDAILTDYSLNDYKMDLPENYTVEYSGGELVDEVLRRKSGFPVFIATSFATTAAQDGFDVKRIYEKKYFQDSSDESNNGTQQHLTFRDRLFHEIKFYKTYISECSDRFDYLVKKRMDADAGGLSLVEEEELIELDKILEESIDGRSKLPDDLRSTSNANKLEDLLGIARELLEKIK